MRTRAASRRSPRELRGVEAVDRSRAEFAAILQRARYPGLTAPAHKGEGAGALITAEVDPAASPGTAALTAA